MSNSEIRKGKVSSVDYEAGMVRVTYKDKDESVTMNIPVLNYNDEYRMPEPGQDVMVAHLSNGSSRAVLLGTVWNQKNIPKETGRQLYRKDLSREKDAAYVRYDDKTGEYLVKAANMHLNGVNETILDGPRVEIASNIFMLLQTEKMQVDTSELEVTSTETDKLSAKIRTDISVNQKENELEAALLRALIDFTEDLKVKTGRGIEMTAEEAVKITAKTEINLSGESNRISGENIVDISSGNTLRFSDGQHSITLAEIMERLGD